MRWTGLRTRLPQGSPIVSRSTIQCFWGRTCRHVRFLKATTNNLFWNEKSKDDHDMRTSGYPILIFVDTPDAVGFTQQFREQFDALLQELSSASADGKTPEFHIFRQTRDFQQIPESVPLIKTSRFFGHLSNLYTIVASYSITWAEKLAWPRSKKAVPTCTSDRAFELSFWNRNRSARICG